MNNFEMFFVALLLLYPLLDWALSQYKSTSKNIEYAKLALYLWVPTVFLGGLYMTGNLSVSEFGTDVDLGWKNLLFLGLLAIAVCYLILLVKSIKSSETLRAEVAKKFEPFMDLMPATKSQMMIFGFVVSVSAGVCEELLFRAYLYSLLESQVGMWLAIAVSSLVFGFWHIYLGWQEVLRTGITGAALCGVYIFTGNIFIPILLHIFIDVYSGVICYFAVREPRDTQLHEEVDASCPS